MLTSPHSLSDEIHSSPQQRKKGTVADHRPTIAITLGSDLPERPHAYRLNRGYVEALLRAGAVPIALAPGLDTESLHAILDDVDGVLLPGGVDPHPSLFDEPIHPSTTIDEPLDALEIEVIEEARRRELPILGICRGSQILNVALGGSLIQDLEPGVVTHRQSEPLNVESHELRLEADSILAGLYGSTDLKVNSLHHQAIGRIGESLRVVGRSEDNIVEAIESDDPQRWIVGVQYHPEELRAPGHERIFAALVDAAKARAARRGGQNPLLTPRPSSAAP